MNRQVVLIVLLITLFSIACGVPAFSANVENVTFTPEVTNIETPQVVPSPMPMSIPVEIKTDTWLRACRSIECTEIGTLAEGVVVWAVCGPDGWCELDSIGLFCYPASQAREGCE